jgi:PEP-CTERM motif
MKRSRIAAVAALGIVLGSGLAARAATLTVSTNKLTYLVGESVTVSVLGDSQGAADSAIDGVLTYSSALTDTPAVPVQSILLSGGIPWIPGVPSFSDGSSQMFVQSRIGAATVSNQLTSTAVLVATGLGTVNLAWLGGLDFFGLTSAAGTSFTVTTPEPGTALLIGAGLVALAIAGRRN